MLADVNVTVWSEAEDETGWFHCLKIICKMIHADCHG